MLLSHKLLMAKRASTVLVYDPDPAELDHAAVGNGLSLYDILQFVGIRTATIRFRHWPDRPADAQGRSVFIFDHPIVVPDNIHVEIQDGAVLQFNQGATTQGALMLGLGGLTIPNTNPQVFDDRTTFKNAVVWPRATLDTANIAWWGAKGDGADASGFIASALYALPEGGTLALPPGHHLMQGGSTATNSVVDIPSGVTVQGAGMGVTVIDVDTLPVVAALQAKKTDSVQVLDLTFQGVPNVQPDARSLKFSRSTNVVVDRVEFIDVPDGLRINDSRFALGYIRVVDTSPVGGTVAYKGIKIYGPSHGSMARFESQGRFLNNCIEIEQGSDPVAWAANTAYAVGNLVIPTSNPTHMWRCITAGTSGASEPNWARADADGLITDGTVVWQEDAVYGRPHDITINQYSITGNLEPMRLREVDNLTLLNGTATNAGYEPGAIDGNVLFDIRRASNVLVDGLTLRNAEPIADVGKLYEVAGFRMRNADICGVNKGIRMKVLSGYGPSSNVVLESTVRMNCGVAKTDPTYVSPDPKRCQVLDGSTPVTDNSDLNTGCP